MSNLRATILAMLLQPTRALGRPVSKNSRTPSLAKLRIATAASSIPHGGIRERGLPVSSSAGLHRDVRLRARRGVSASDPRSLESVTTDNRGPSLRRPRPLRVSPLRPRVLQPPPAISHVRTETDEQGRGCHQGPHPRRGL